MALIVVSLAYNAYAWSQANGANSKSNYAIGDAPVVGTKPVALAAKRLTDDTLVLIQSASKDRLLYFLTPDCGWCRRNAAALTALWTQLRGQYEFIGLTHKREGLEKFLAEHPIPFEVLSVEDLSFEVMQEWGLGVTPNLILLGGDGTIKRVWAGAFTGERRAALESHFKISLQTAGK